MIFLRYSQSKVDARTICERSCRAALISKLCKSLGISEWPCIGNRYCLLNENVLLDSSVPLLPMQMDLPLMLLSSSLERTKKQWLGLLDTVGFDALETAGSGSRFVVLFEAVPRL